MKAAVLGPGGVGGFLAAAFARAGIDTVVVAREETAEVVAREGIAVRSVRLGDFTAHPRATARLEEDADVLFVATKATGLEAALDRVAAARPGLVVPLLNGLDHVARLRDRFGAERVPAATIRIESTREAPGRIVQESPNARVELAPPGPAVERLVAEVLEPAGIDGVVSEREAQVLWSKLARLSVLALVTTAADRPIGPLRQHPTWRGRIGAAVDEVAAVAVADGADIEAARVMAEIDGIHPTLRTSMQRDVAAGREPELDAIAGAVLRAAGRHDIACPTITRLRDHVAERVRTATAASPGGAG